MSSSDRNEFRNFVSCVFSNWSGLQLAIDHGMGGSHIESTKKASDMTDHITNSCLSQRLSDWIDIADDLEDLMDQYFDTVLEDGSPEEIAQLLWNFSRQWLAGDKESVTNYITNLKKVPVKKNNHQPVSSGQPEQMETNTGENNSSGDVVSNSTPEDDWTVVTNKRHRN